jgi:hypothetical protein
MDSPAGQSPWVPYLATLISGSAPRVGWGR